MYKSTSPVNHYDAQMGKEIFKCFEENMDNYTDFTVNVSDTEFMCHRFVLSSCSGFFEALMRTDMREKSESSCIIEGISPETFGLILEVVYKGTNVLDEENMLDMWHASNQLQIKFLVMACEDYIKDNITLQNFWGIYQTAKLLDSSTIVTKVKQLMVNSFPRVVESDAFMQISLEELIDLLKHFRIVSDFVVNSILKWTCSDASYLKTESNKGIITSFMAETETGLQKLRCRKVNVSTDEVDDLTLRRSYIGQLLAAIPLKDISNACLSKLMNNKFVIDNKDAITLVNKYIATRLEATTPQLIKTYKTVIKPPATPKPASKNNKSPEQRAWQYCDIPEECVFMVIFLLAAFGISCVILKC